MTHPHRAAHRQARVGRRGLAGLLVVLLALLVPSTVLAQDFDEEAQPDVRLVVTSIDGLVGPGVDPPAEGEPAETADLGLRVLVENRGEVDVSDLQVVVQVHESVGGARSRLAQALDEQVIPGRTLEIERVDVRDGGELAPGDIAGEQITVDGDRIGWRETQDVYPVQIAVLFGTQVLDEVVTAAVHLVNPPERPLKTSVVVPVSSPTTRTAAGRYEEAVPDDLAPGGRLDVLLSAVERVPDMPLVLAPETELVEELADRGDGFTLVDGTRVASDDPAAQRADRLLERLRAVVTEAPLAPVVGPYGRADVAALASTSNEEVANLANVAIETARIRAQQLLGRAPAGDLYLSTTPLTQPSLSLLDVDTHLLLPFDQMAGGADLLEELNVGHARHVVPSENASPQRVGTIADPRVTRAITAPPVEAGPAVVHQRLLAETALLYLTRPSEAGRTLLVLPPVQWDPARGTASSLLQALRDSPWLELVAPGQAGLGPTGDEAPLGTGGAILPAIVSAELIAARAQLGALRAAMPDGSPELDGQTVADLDDALLRAVTPETIDNGGAEALARIQAVREVTEDAFGEVRLADSAGVTLTSDTGEVPITLQRTDGGPIELLVEVSSGSSLLWEETGQQQRVTLPEDASRTVAFSARAVARGTFPVTVRVFDPTHRKLLDTATVPVRSTSISRTALVIIGGVVLVLLALGARRRRSPNLEVVR